MAATVKLPESDVCFFQPQINALISETATIQRDIEDAAARYTSLEQSLSTLQSSREALLTRRVGISCQSTLCLVNEVRQ